MSAHYPYGEFYASLKRGDVVFVNENAPHWQSHLVGRKYIVSGKRYGTVEVKQSLDHTYVAQRLDPTILTREVVSLEELL